MVASSSPVNTRRLPNVGFMLGQRRRRWTNLKLTLGQRVMFAGKQHVFLPAVDIFRLYALIHIDVFSFC